MRKNSTKGLWVLILLVGIFAFELFNFDTTKLSLEYILGTGQFASLSHAAWLAIGACAIDFGGLARIFTEETKLSREGREIWALLFAWFVASIFNAVLTWVFVSVNLENGGATLPSVWRASINEVAIFIAAIVWLVRFSLIMSFGVVAEGLNFKLPSFNRKKGFDPSPYRGNTPRRGKENPYSVPVVYSSAAEETEGKVL